MSHTLMRRSVILNSLSVTCTHTYTLNWLHRSGHEFFIIHEPFVMIGDSSEKCFLKTAKSHSKISGTYCTTSNYKNHHYTQKMSFHYITFVYRKPTTMECINCYNSIDTHCVLRVELDMNVSFISNCLSRFALPTPSSL